MKTKKLIIKIQEQKNYKLTGKIIEREVDIIQVYYKYFAIHYHANYEELNKVLHNKHKINDKRYSITHIKTGALIISLKSIARCKRFIREVRDFINWNTDNFNDIQEQGREKGIQDIIQDHSLKNLYNQ